MSEFDSGMVDVVAFAGDWVQLNSVYGTDVEAFLTAGDKSSRLKILQYLNPKQYGKPADVPRWEGVFHAAMSTLRHETDIGLATRKALDVLEKRLGEPGYLEHTSGQQLWVVTDSEEEAKNDLLDQNLSRMTALRSKLWFEYHEIAFVTPSQRIVKVRDRHKRIVDAGFSVDYSATLGKWVRVPAPWPVDADNKAAAISGGIEVPCVGTADEFDVQIQPPLVFDTCNERGERVPGRFNLKFHTVSSAIQNLQVAEMAVSDDGFGKPIQSLHVKGPVRSLAPGSTVEASFTVQYDFTTPGYRVSYLSRPETSVRLKFSRPPPPSISVRPLMPVSTDCVAPNSLVAKYEVVSTATTNPVIVNLKLANVPQDALWFGTDGKVGGATKTLTLSAADPRQIVEVFGGNPDSGIVTSTLSIEAAPSGDCAVVVNPTAVPLRACFSPNAALTWLHMGDAGDAAPPSQLTLIWTADSTTGEWAYKGSLEGNWNTGFKLIFPNSSSEKYGCMLTLEGSDTDPHRIQFALTLDPSGESAKSESEIHGPGETLARLALWKNATAGVYNGFLRITPKNGLRINNNANEVKIPIELRMTADKQ